LAETVLGEVLRMLEEVEMQAIRAQVADEAAEEAGKSI
jgi:hypothetical protein